jgi:UDP-galactopyranose mutase
VPRKENTELYAKYKALADITPGVHFVGRLATYKYYNMDQIVAQALTVYSKISGAKRAESTLRVAGQQQMMIPNTKLAAEKVAASAL